jgi:hypothetical protein
VRPRVPWTYVKTNHGRIEYAKQAEEARAANDVLGVGGRHSTDDVRSQADGTKLGNASEGKAVQPIRVSNQAPAIHSDGSPLLNRLERITKRAEADKATQFNNL